MICVRADIPLLFFLQLFLAQQCLDHSAGSWTLEHFLISMCHTSILATYYSNQMREQLTVVSQVTELCKRNCDKNSSKGITFGTKVSNKIWEDLSRSDACATRLTKMTYRELRRTGLFLAGFLRRPVSLQFGRQLRFSCPINCLGLGLRSGFN